MNGEQAAQDLVDDLLRSSQRAMLVRAFCELKIADHLHPTPMSLEDMSVAMAADKPALRRLLRALVPLGLCDEDGGGRYSLTPAGQMFTSSALGGAAKWASLLTAPWIQRAWEQLGPAVKAGRTYFADVHGVGFWEYVATHTDEAAAFDATMTTSALARGDDLMSALQGAVVSELVDVGGGQGALLASLLGEHPGITGTVLDRPEVVAERVQVPDGVGDRLHWIGGDFLRDIPPGADVYLLSRILHDWPDAEAVTIVQACSAAMKPGARLCILEQISPELSDQRPTERLDLALKDLNMLVLVGGQERTLVEYERLLRRAALGVEHVHKGRTCDVIVARKPSRSSA